MRIVRTELSCPRECEHPRIKGGWMFLNGMKGYDYGLYRKRSTVKVTMFEMESMLLIL